MKSGGNPPRGRNSMSTLIRPAPRHAEPSDLHTGDRMTQEEFHRLYERMPEGFKAELIGGIVYVASALRRDHGSHHVLLSAIFAGYGGPLAGVECCDNTTVLLGKKGEPQPDLLMRI